MRRVVVSVADPITPPTVIVASPVPLRVIVPSTKTDSTVADPVVTPISAPTGFVRGLDIVAA